MNSSREVVSTIPQGFSKTLDGSTPNEFDDRAILVVVGSDWRLGCIAVAGGQPPPRTEGECEAHPTGPRAAFSRDLFDDSLGADPAGLGIGLRR